jgi:hypothetical protein
MAIKATVDGNKLIIIADMDTEPKVSQTGKSLVVASTKGFMETDIKVAGKTLKLNFNAVISNK